MSILLTLWRLITGNKVARAIGGALMAIAAVLTFGAIKKREGARTAKSDAAIKAAKDYQKTTERMQDAEAAMGDDPAVLRDRMRERDPDQR